MDEFKFNWTMSYRLDAEVSDCSYGCSYTSKEQSDIGMIAKYEFKKRENSAVWFVSNCDSKYRIDFASSLKSFYSLKVFGSCAKFISSRKDNYYVNFVRNLVQVGCDRYSKCESNEMRINKFYLSFESKNCTNYLTEKVWRILRSGLIPVVLQPEKKFYELNLPPNSFIHAQDFEYDPERLAVYLNQVSNNFDLYFSHLAWKNKYDIVYSAKQVERRRMCEFCTKLNTERSVIYYESVSQWFNNKCVIN